MQQTLPQRAALATQSGTAVVEPVHFITVNHFTLFCLILEMLLTPMLLLLLLLLLLLTVAVARMRTTGAARVLEQVEQFCG